MTCLFPFPIPTSSSERVLHLYFRDIVRPGGFLHENVMNFLIGRRMRRLNLIGWFVAGTKSVNHLLALLLAALGGAQEGD